LEKYLEKFTPKSTDPRSANWWQNYPKYTVSFLKAVWGDKATAESKVAARFTEKSYTIKITLE
jgi:formate dehydrogenase major subunit